MRNCGNLPHELMLMPPQDMNALAYRLERADWKLTEHGAIFERPVVLPGDSFELFEKVEVPGMWSYMCMFPFHMQFAMMGMMITEGTTMDDGMGMGGMKM